MAMYYKGVYNRRRPSQLEPLLLPPVAVPGHASYPSGHATQAFLIAKCAALAVQLDPRTDKARVVKDLDALAARIARNREIGGFHYRSDSKAGRRLAEGIFSFIEANRASTAPNIVKITGYAAIVGQAQQEWQ
jgi:hypothetical protein